MCGRYTLFTEEQTEDIRNIIREVQEKQPENNMKSGEIFPTNTAPILKAEGGQLGADLAIWGFPKFDGKGVIINARSETAEQKKMFRDSLLTRRCAIPSTGFTSGHRMKENKNICSACLIQQRYIWRDSITNSKASGGM